MWRTSTRRHSTHLLVLARSFTILRLGEGLTSFDKNNCFNFSGERGGGGGVILEEWSESCVKRLIRSLCCERYGECGPWEVGVGGGRSYFGRVVWILCQTSDQVPVLWEIVGVWPGGGEGGGKGVILRKWSYSSVKLLIRSLCCKRSWKLWWILRGCLSIWVAD